MTSVKGFGVAIFFCTVAEFLIWIIMLYALFIIFWNFGYNVTSTHLVLQWLNLHINKRNEILEFLIKKYFCVI